MCVRHHVEDAVNGKAVHGTGGVNYLPHMFVLFMCMHASAAVSLAQGHNATDLCLGTEALGIVQGRSAAIVDEDDRFKENVGQAHLCEIDRAPKGSLGPKGSIREVVLRSLRSYLTLL